MGDSTLKISAACFGGGLVSGFLMSSLVKNLTPSVTAECPPEKWVQVGRVSQLIIYPVKCLPGIYVQEAEVTPVGLKANNTCRDRVFMVTNSKGDFQSPRNIPFLTQINPSVEGTVLRLSLRENAEECIAVPFPRNEQKNRRMYRIWTDQIAALDCGDEVGAWLSKVTGTNGLRLCYHASTRSQRKVAPNQAKFLSFSSNDTGTLQDETSYMLMTEESMEALNSKLDIPITAKSFRPSILINGSPGPWTEDLWSYIRIGDGNSPVFKASMPCQRCKVTTLDPDTGKPREDGEPIKTLMSMKREFGDQGVAKLVKKMAIMGTHMGLFNNRDEELDIKVGDPVYAALL